LYANESPVSPERPHRACAHGGSHAIEHFFVGEQSSALDRVRLRRPSIDLLQRSLYGS
jgi:hypothetical protein